MTQQKRRQQHGNNCNNGAPRTWKLGNNKRHPQQGEYEVDNRVRKRVDCDDLTVMSFKGDSLHCVTNVVRHLSVAQHLWNIASDL